jgi:tyrosyl-tRNA synthetase
MTLPEELKARGLVEHTSSDLEETLAKPRVVYTGFDSSSDSLQIGNLAALLTMKRLGEAGHKLIFLAGGATSLIGDPKEAGERPMQDEKTVASNIRACKAQVKKIFGKTPFKLVDNADWLMRIELLPFLREVGKYFTVNDLIKREIIKKRLDNPDDSISFTEFSYSLLQGFDYYYLHKKQGVDLQIGGTDQWTNILSGVDLVHKKAGEKVYAFTIPLVTDAGGKKFGKSEGNAIWLDPKKTTPFDFYQFWINLPDSHVEQYLKIYTFLSLAEITMLMEVHKRNPAEREAQETLARLVTEIVHGPAVVAQCTAVADALFGETPFEELSREALQAVLGAAPSLALSKRDLSEGMPLTDILVLGGLASSKSDARRSIEGKGITLSGLTISDPDQKLFVNDLSKGHALIRKGKRGVLVLVLK